MAQHNTNQQNTILKACGFRIDTPTRRTQAIRDLQTALGIGVDGIWGPKTTAAAQTFQNNSYRLSTNFKITEFACKCGGKYAACARVKVTPELVKVLQTIRTRHYPDGLIVISSYRCPAHNKAVGGASASQHLTGKAADLTGRITTAQAQAAGAKGIGYGKTTKRVNHIDVRTSPAVFVDGN
jgi:uncharacterized protein YcbK (DUF882 family)